MEEGILIFDFAPQYAKDFADLNYRWIEAYFKIEAADRQYLDHPEKMIIDKGGAILFVSFDGEIIGTCALIKASENRFELAKMAIDPKFQGKGIGYQLGMAVIEKARSMGASKIFLESNTVLASAIHLYNKLGFKEIKGFDSPYERSNIQMELVLN